MVKSLVSKLSSASNLSIASTLSSMSASMHSATSGSGGVQETNYYKHRNDPGRFFGDGVQFKAKLIGILEVGEARGDRMCQEALQDLKMAIRAAGEHKQRITIHVTIDGLRLRDEKTNDSLYHHPVHKISFIAQDMTDSRAFGYIFGSPDSGHRFFGIKTDKAASQVVLAMRDLFQVVFELKKKEIELARQQIQSKSIHEHQTLSSLASLKSVIGHNDLSGSGGAGGPSSLSMLSSLSAGAAGSNIKMGYNTDNKTTSTSNVKEMSPESVADLVDLEQELSSIQRGITQMERITPSEPTPTLGKSGNEEDPFGDSFTNFPTYNLLPPPESSRSRSKPNKPPDTNVTTTTANMSSVSTNVSTITSLLSAAPISNNSPSNLQQDDDDSWLNELDQQNDVFDTSKTGLMGLGVGMSTAPLAPCETTSTPTSQLLSGTDLELPTTIAAMPATSAPAMVTATATTTTSDAPSISSQPEQTQTSAPVVKSDSCPTAAAGSAPGLPSTGADPVMLPRDTDPFSPTRKKSDPFQEGDIFSNMDPFEFEFNATKETTNTQQKPPQQQQQQQNQPQQQHMHRSSPSTTEARKSADVFNGPLQVSLPPECGSMSPQTVETQWRQSDVLGGGVAGMSNSSARSRPSPSSAQFQSAANASAAFKQQTADVISSISNKKMPHLFGQARFSKRDSNSINMRRLQESDSLSENETAPEPPPRPDSVSHAEPPPLPPKKQFSDIIIRPRIGSTSGSASSSNRYEFLNSYSKAASGSSRSAGNSDVPPIPLPSRRVGRSDGTYPGPGRPRKPGHTEDDYLAPIGAAAGGPTGVQSDVPPLLPPPTQVSSRARSLRQLSQQAKSQDIYENKAEIMQQKTTDEAASEASAAAPAIIPDITLSQLLTLGIDELATKLNVPTSKLSTMTLVELTSYLSEFIEKSKPTQPQTASAPHREHPHAEAEAAIFKVNFDQEATFVAKFDDNFGEDDITSSQPSEPFVANFEQFNEPPVAVPPPLAAGRTPSVPPADRYAVFREIIDQELQQQQQDTDLLGDMLPEQEESNVATKASNVLVASAEDVSSSPQFVANFSDDDNLLNEAPVPPKIDTKITEVVAQAKDRYAALRDIILVENLFDKKPPSQSQPPHERQQNLMQDFTEFGDELNEDQDLKQIMENDRASSRGFPAEASSSALTVEDEDEDDEDDGAAESSLDSNEKDGRGRELSQDQYKKLSASNQQLDVEKPEKGSNIPSIKQDSKFLMVAGSSGLSSSKDDLEIDELMQRAISNLSLDSRERTSPATAPATGTPSTDAAAAARTKDTSPSLTAKSQFNDVSTSPIPLQKSPAPPAQQQPTQPTQGKSPQLSPIPTQLTAVSNLIDTASRQMSADQSPQSKESWATFESPKPAFPPPQVEKHRTQKRDRRRSKSPKGITLHLPPPPPSNASQNDTAESPCSSDARDDGWSKGGGARRWPKQERGGGGGSNAPQTSSSSRDLSPWDDEAPDAYPKQRRGLPSQAGPSGQPISHTDRHGYYMRHARRMNSCDEDYDYDDDFSKRRDHRKFKQGISRSRDNFEFDTSKWYHHPQHHTWSPQDEESSLAGSSRARSFDRSAYERTTYGPPIYDKRGIALPQPATSSYDRRSGGYDKRKYYREYSRPNYDFDGYGEPPQERRGRRNDYENIYDVDSRSPMGYGKARGADYIYERDRKSFDRESVESFDSATRRRRSFGSGDVYGSLESREDFRERYMGGDPKATRSLRKSCVKMRATGDIDYEDSDINEFQQQRSVRGSSMDTRSLQRPSQLGSVGSIGGVGGQQRVRKSSGSSPWDGEEPMPHIGAVPGSQKSWKRPSSAAESERRLAESRRAAILAQTPSGSDGEKDRRFRKKQRIRGKDLPLGVSASVVAAQRYAGGSQNVPAHSRDNYDYVTYPNDGDEDVDDEDYVDEDYDEPPTDEDKFERLNRRRHEMHQRMLESERRQHSMGKTTTSALKSSVASKAGNKYHGLQRPEFVDFDDFESTTTATPRSGGAGSGMSTTTPGSMGATKFSFDDHGGFESDFNQSSPPPAPAGTASSCNSTPAVTASATTTPATKSSFRFSNDFSEREKLQQFGGHNSMSISSLQQFEIDNQSTTSPSAHVTPPITQKLRFDDNVKISKFDNDAHTAAFEDDFAKADFHFEKEDQWNADGLQVAATAKKNNLRNSKMQQRQELIKKSESINIFAKKSDDPFEDDEFFNAPNATIGEDGQVKGTAENDGGFQ